MTETQYRPPVVRMAGIDKQFYGVPVLHDVHMDLFPGEVHALAGENGAGKSTLMKILAGILQPDGGTIEIEGREVRIPNPRCAIDLGIAIVHQELSLAPNLTVAENFALGREPRNNLFLLDRKRLLREGQSILERMGARFPVTQKVERLSTGEQQLVEIGHALSEDPRVFILDEPTAALSDREVHFLFDIVRAMRDDGITVVYITHRMEEIQELADRVTVLRDGAWVETLDKAAATPEAVVTRMVGRPLETLYEHDQRSAGEVRLEARGLTDGRKVAPTDLQIKAGEVVGLAGLIGAGRTELARLIFGADRATAGEVLVDGQPVSIREPGDAIRRGIGLVPESRKDQGLFLGMSVAENITLSTPPPKFSWAGVVNRQSVSETARRYVDKMRIRIASIGQPVSDLSGGNQQKVVLAKWLNMDPKVLLLDEPTRGVDVGAKAEIYGLINEVAAQGIAVLFISSQLPEVLGMSDRVLVMREGRIVAELEGERATEEETIRYATGIVEAASA